MKFETEIVLQFEDEGNADLCLIAMFEAGGDKVAKFNFEDLLKENFEIQMSENRRRNLKKCIAKRMRKFIKELEKN